MDLVLITLMDMSFNSVFSDPHWNYIGLEYVKRF